MTTIDAHFLTKVLVLGTVKGEVALVYAKIWLSSYTYKTRTSNDTQGSWNLGSREGQQGCLEGNLDLLLCSTLRHCMNW